MPPTDYTGNSLATQAPSAAPSVGIPPIVRLPTGTDPFDVTAYYQALKVLADYITWLMGQAIASPFGHGSDGDVTETSRTITRAQFYENLIVGDGITLNNGGFPIYVRRTLTFLGTGKISASGADGIPLTGGPGAGGGGGSAGKQMFGGSNGGVGVWYLDIGVRNASPVVNSFGGAGGNGGGGATGGACTPPAPERGYPTLQCPPGFIAGLVAQVATLTGYGGGGGGGAGAADTTSGAEANGGGGGGGGGVLYLAARRIELVTAGQLIAAGGAGAVGGATGRGGGGGGGGCAVLIYGSKTSGVTFSAAVNAPGGARYDDGGVTDVSTNGLPGTLIDIPLY